MSDAYRPGRALEMIQALRRRLAERNAVAGHAPVPVDIDLDQLAMQALRRPADVDTSPAVLQIRGEGPSPH